MASRPRGERMARRRSHRGWPIQSLTGRRVAGTVAAAVFRPRLLGQAGYAGLGIALGFGSTKLLRFASGGGLTTALASLEPKRRAAAALRGGRGALRALVLRIDPSLEESEGDTLRWGDLRGPGRNKKKPKKP